MVRASRWKATQGGPSYDCLHCRRPELEKENRGQCSTCSLTRVFRNAWEQAAEDVEELLDEEPEAAEFTTMDEIFGTVCRELGENGGRIDPEWSPEFAQFARIVAYEQHRLEFEEGWERLQALKHRK